MAKPLAPADVVQLAAHAQLRFDGVRQAWMLLGPERVFTPSESAVAILQACDGVASIRQVAQKLAAEFSAPADVIERDCLMVLAMLEAKGYLARGSAA